MRFIITLLRLLALLIGFIGIFTCVILIGFLLIALSEDINEFADKIEDKHINKKRYEH